MRIGIFGGTVNDGTIDDVVAEARQAEADGFDAYWAPQIFGHDALTALAVVGREVPRIELGTERRADVPAPSDDARPAGADRERSVAAAGCASASG